MFIFMILFRTSVLSTLLYACRSENVTKSVGTCGVNRFNNEPPLTERIVGGKSSHEGEWPWQVSLRLQHPLVQNLAHWCGAVLIDTQWLATAAHCILNPVFSLPQASFWSAHLGLHSQNILNESHIQEIRVSRLVYHPWYRGYENDIALMKLQFPVKASEHVQPICMPSINATIPLHDLECVSTGWGKLNYNKRGPEVLQKVRIQVYDNSVCHKAYYNKFRIQIKSSHLCAGANEGGKGTCHGDSGGPLQCKINNQWFLFGITSFGSSCAKPGFPDVYSRVSFYLNWIKQVQEIHNKDSTLLDDNSSDSL